MNRALEIAANGFNAASILLAGRNSVHTWWTGLVGCALFSWVFFASRLYADVTLQVFFVVTSVLGWWSWQPHSGESALVVQRTTPRALLVMFALALLCAAGYALILHRFTDAYAPIADSAVLTFSVLGQLLLMKRRVENWWAWLLVNTIAVPLYASRGLYITAALYVVFLLNALVSLRHWRRLLGAS